MLQTELDRLKMALEQALAGPPGDEIREALRGHHLPSYGMTIGELAELQELEETLKPLYRPSR
jgi:hypothetical protein